MLGEVKEKLSINRKDRLMPVREIDEEDSSDEGNNLSLIPLLKFNIDESQSNRNDEDDQRDKAILFSSKYLSNKQK